MAKTIPIATALAGLASAGRVAGTFALGAAAMNPRCLEHMAKTMAEAEGETWSKAKPEKKHLWTMRASGAIKAFNSYLYG